MKLGLGVGTFAGVMSACFAFGLDAGNPIKALTLTYGTGTVWQGLPVLVVALAGGFTTNLVWCSVLNVRNHSYGEYLRVPVVSELVKVTDGTRKAPSLFGNYLFSGLAGAIWYFGVFFYTMGESQMGRYKFSGWTLLNASVIIFSTLWGIALKEWPADQSAAAFESSYPGRIHGDRGLWEFSGSAVSIYQRAER